MLFLDAGPWQIFQRVREVFGVGHDKEGLPVDYPENSVFVCLGCLSVWVAIFLWLLPGWVSALLAVSALAVLTHNVWERLTGGPSIDANDSLD